MQSANQSVSEIVDREQEGIPSEGIAKEKPKSIRLFTPCGNCCCLPFLTFHLIGILVFTWEHGSPEQGLHFLVSLAARSGLVIKF